MRKTKRNPLYHTNTAQYSEYTSVESVRETKNVIALICKLGKYEDIDEKNHIDYPVLSKMFNDGIYYCNAIDAETKAPVSIVKLRPFRLIPEEYTILALVEPDLQIEVGGSNFTVVKIQTYNYKKKNYLGAWALRKEDLL